jgi:phospholipase C
MMTSNGMGVALASLVALPGMWSCSGLEEGELDAPAAGTTSAGLGLPADPSDSGIEHVVVVMMENRSFDHMMGWVPGADGEQAGLAFPDESGALVATHALAPDYQGCGHPDPDHSFEGGRIEYNGGACDGWLLAGSNDEYSIGFYTAADLPFYSRAARRFVTLDRYFSSLMAETFPNRIYQYAAQTDRLDNSLALSTLPTIWDRLAEEGITRRYYYSDLPFVALWGLKYLPISRPVTQFLADAVNGDLPQVSFVDPRFLGEAEGLSGDDHPHADIRNGQAFLNIIYTAVTRSPGWRNTVLVINYDEWGGFFDHVPPPTAPIPPADEAAGATDGLLGFRTPAMVIAPWATPGAVSHMEFDHTSVLKMIEWRWGLEPLTVRDATANNLAEALDFTRRRAPAPGFAVPLGPFGELCAPEPSPQPEEEVSLGSILELAEELGWPIPTATEADLAAELSRLLEARP